MNVDLCFVPTTHTPAEAKLPAVSGSSGRLVVERPRDERSEPAYPGQAFAALQQTYSEAMQAFVTASTATATPVAAPADLPPRKAAQQALRHQAAALRDQRRARRQQRRQEDAAWRLLRQQHRVAPVPLARSGRWDCSATLMQRTSALHWRVLRLQRRLTLKRRQREDAAWREARHRLRERLAQPRLSAWIAILVITDNCTRQCLGLPLFVVGAKVTAELIVEALRTLLPPDLQFLISERGTHFTAQVFAQFAREADFVHVLIARHRPQSNGIAERFVRTLKEWLADKTWESAAELEMLLNQMHSEYNERPHQGLAIPGLSPNAFAERIWLM